MGQAELVIEDGEMGKEKIPKPIPVRLSEEAIKWARIASGFTGESVAEYVTRIVTDKAKEDSERFSSEVVGHGTKRGKK
jgi:hypothetical protein